MKRTIGNRIMVFASSVLLILIGIALLAVPELAISLVCPVLAVSMLLVSVVQIVSYVTTPVAKNMDSNGFGIGVLLLILGVTIMLRQEWVMQAIPFVLGLLIALNGIRELQNGVDVARLKIKRAWIVVVVALVNLALGVILMADPFTALATLTTALGGGLIVSGAADLVTTLVVYSKSRQTILTDVDRIGDDQI